MRHQCDFTATQLQQGDLAPNNATKMFERMPAPHGQGGDTQLHTGVVVVITEKELALTRLECALVAVDDGFVRGHMPLLRP